MAPWPPEIPPGGVIRPGVRVAAGGGQALMAKRLLYEVGGDSRRFFDEAPEMVGVRSGLCEKLALFTNISLKL